MEEAKETGAPVGVTKDTSGVNGAFPDELRGFNWAAFLLNWVWSIGNNVWIGLLCFIPFVGIVMPFILGFKGNEWAWQHRKFASIDEFKAVQKAWTKWAVLLFILGIILSILSLVVLQSMFSSLANGDYSTYQTY